MIYDQEMDAMGHTKVQAATCIFLQVFPNVDEDYAKG